MTVKAGYSTPMLHVADVARSLRFYALLGSRRSTPRVRRATSGGRARTVRAAA